LKESNLSAAEGSSFTITCEKTFIVIDKLDWEDRCVLLVLNGSLLKMVKEKPCGDRVWRMTLLDALSAITRLSNDEQRKIRMRDEK
jgi:hypothetical protein